MTDVEATEPPRVVGKPEDVVAGLEKLALLMYAVTAWDVGPIIDAVDLIKREIIKPAAEDGRVPLNATFSPEDVAMIEGAATLVNPCYGDAVKVGNAIADIVGEWFDNHTKGYMQPEAEK